MSSAEQPELLCRVNFPLYQATMVTERHILFAGGGGAARTGVQNGFVSDLSFGKNENGPYVLSLHTGDL